MFIPTSFGHDSLFRDTTHAQNAAIKCEVIHTNIQVPTGAPPPSPRGDSVAGFDAGVLHYKGAGYRRNGSLDLRPLEPQEPLKVGTVAPCHHRPDVVHPSEGVMQGGPHT